ncbi:MAG: hypothetical protein ACFE7R_04020 [Candidatus Hodarchaeota archaeon]
MALDTWFHVMFDDESIDIHIHPPNGEESRARLKWSEIVRVCFKPADFLGSDEILIFTKGRETSYLIPVEADGGLALWNDIISRNLFDAELAIKIAMSTDDEYHCWPIIEE